MSVHTLTVLQDGTVVADRLDTVLIASLAALFIPLLVNLLTKHSASDGMRAIVNIVAVALDSTLVLWTNPTGVPVTWYVIGNTFLAALISSFTAYKAVWKPTGVSGSVTNATKNFGVGSPPTLQTDSKGAEEMGQVDNEPNA